VIVAPGGAGDSADGGVLLIISFGVVTPMPHCRTGSHRLLRAVMSCSTVPQIGQGMSRRVFFSP
jgi:hypothetical protein